MQPDPRALLSLLKWIYSDAASFSFMPMSIYSVLWPVHALHSLSFYNKMAKNVPLTVFADICKAFDLFSLQAPSNKTFYRFKPMTLVPFEPNLIDTELLTKSQVSPKEEGRSGTKKTKIVVGTTNRGCDRGRRGCKAVV